MNEDKSKIFESRGDSKELVVILHAYNNTHHNLQYVRETVAESMPHADIFTPDLPTSLYSFTPYTDIISHLLDRIDDLWNKRASQNNPYQSIIFVGHSMGALFARKLYVCACGENEEAPFNDSIDAKEPRPWAKCVERLVLIAGMNRGWAINHHMSLLRAFLWTIGVFIGNIMMKLRGRQPIIYTIRRGATFLTNLRIQWLLMRRRAKDSGIGNALTIQLLGSIDDMVSPSDNIDLISGHDFIYLDVPQSGHVNIIQMDESPAGRERSDIFKKALVGSRRILEEEQVLPADNPAGEPKPDVTDVVFVIHGIRDEGYWTHKIARRVREKSKGSKRVFATITSSYGYFPILRFLLPGERRNKTQWFMDRYVEALALYPNAKFSYVGHSNGTYLLARALSDYRCCRFNRVVFAGSVVRRKYDWESHIKHKQVNEVANYVATADWVVAFFPKAIEMLRIQDLGSAGHDGFSSKAISQVQYVNGAHSAAIKECNWDKIADFILTGGHASVDQQLIGMQRSPLVLIPGIVAPAIWLLIVGLVVLGAYVISLTHSEWHWPEWRTTALYGLYLYVLWTVLMKL